MSNLALMAQHHVFIEDKIMAPPNLSDKSTIEKPPKLLDQVRDKLRVKHYSISTEQVYLDWIKRYILFHDKQHPKDMGAADVEAFLTHLAVAGKVAASTQNQAKSALLFLFREVLAVLSRLSGSHLLVASLLYGTGMRLGKAGLYK